ncbi:MAG: cupin domain-containing protein [Pseudomonadota bacterium]
MPKIDRQKLPIESGTRYPPPHDAPCRDRRWQALGQAAGLSQFGVNLVTLSPGAWSSQRHWHALEDEFVYILEGELVLVTDAGEEVMRAGDCAGFKAGVKDGHHLQNRSDEEAVFLAIGSRDDKDHGVYSDIDMTFIPGRYSGGGGYRHKDGKPYPPKA